MTTMAQRVDTVTAFLKATWQLAILAGAFVAVLLLVRTCNRATRAEDELARVQEAAGLEAKNHVVAQRVTTSALASALSLSPPLKAEIARLEKDLGEKPRIVTVERIVTVPVRADGTIRPSNGTIPGKNETLSGCGECLLARGDTGQIRVDSAHVETSKGNEVVALSAECWRLTPTESLILSGTASAPLSRVVVVTPPARLGWGFGAGGGIGTTGPVGSVVVQTGPIFSDRLSAEFVPTLGKGYAGLQLFGMWR